MGNRWTHSVCDECWTKRSFNPDPLRLRESDEEACCYCGKKHRSGIYYREDPAAVACRGEGGTHAEVDADG